VAAPAPAPLPTGAQPPPTTAQPPSPPAPTTSGTGSGRDRDPVVVEGAGSTQDAIDEKRRWGLTALLLILGAGAVAARAARHR
jgi:hypothetical protein